MNIRNLIAILVCLGMVAFASSTASAFSLKEVFTDTIAEGITVTSTLNKTLLRVHSGYRLNRAQDDGSGLGTSIIVSETYLRTDDGLERTGGFEWSGGYDNHFIDAETDSAGYTYMAVESFNLEQDKWNPGILKAGLLGGIEDEIDFPMEGYSEIKVADMAVSEDGTVYLLGSAQLDIARLNRDLFLIRHHPDGTDEFFTYSSGAGDDEGRKIIVDIDGNITAASQYEKGDAGTDVDIWSIGADGTVVWKTTKDSGLIDTYGGMDYDPPSNNILLATNYIGADPEKFIPQFTRLNSSDGSIEIESDLLNDQSLAVALTAVSLGTDTTDWLAVAEETGPDGVTRSVVGVVDPETFEVRALLSDDENSIYFAVSAYNTSGGESDYTDEVAGGIVGRRPDGTGFKAVITTEPALRIIEREQLPDYGLILYGDELVVLEYGPDAGSLSLVGFEITEAEQVAVPVGTDVTVSAPESDVSVTFANVFNPGDAYFESNPDGSLPIPTYFELEGREITRITTDAGYSGDNYISITYDDSSVTDELKLIVIRSDPEDPEGGWINLPIAERSEETNTLVAITDHFSDFAVGSYTDLAGAIQNLIYVIEGWNLEGGWVNSLDAKLQKLMDALSAANAGNRGDAINKVDAFINEVEAQRGNKLTEAQADRLISEATAIKVNL